MSYEFPISVAFPLLAILLWGEPYERGYFEDDETIRLPFKQESISEGLLAGLGFGVIVVTVRYRLKDNKKKNP